MTDRFHSPEGGIENWHLPLNENFDLLETLVEHRQPAANRFSVDPVQGKKWLSTDTGTIYIGTGTQWRELGTIGAGSGGTTSSGISIADDGAVLADGIDVINAGTNLDAAISGDGNTATLTATATTTDTGGGGGETVVEDNPEVERAVDYGADPTGAVDSSTALQDAINAASPGSKVVFGEPGTYYLNSEIRIDKRVDVDLRAGTIESDYTDTGTYEDQNHYRPLFRIGGTEVAETTLSAQADRGTDQITVTDPTLFSKGDGVVVRNASTPYGVHSVPYYDYSSTPTRVREIDGSTLYLEDEIVDTYAAGQFVTQVDYVHRPTLRNVNVLPRVEPYFNSDAGKVLGGPRHIVATELCDQPRIENVEAESYDSHLWTGYDDRKARVLDCTAINPLNLSGSCGEPFVVHGSIQTEIVRPTIRECRRGIDARSGAGTITVHEPDVVGISFVGVSWHSISTVKADMVIHGGRFDCRPTDPTMQNQDGSLPQRRELQQGRPFNTGSLGRFESHGTTYVGRIDGILNGETYMTGGEVFKYSSSGTVVSLNGDDIHIEGMRFSADGSISELVEVETTASNVDLRDITLDCDCAPSYAIDILGGSNIDVAGKATAGATNRVVNVGGGTNVSLDLDMTANGSYAYVIDGVTGLDVSGRIDGACSGEVIYLTGGSDITLDCDIYASGSNTVRGIRVFSPDDVHISGIYEGPAIGVMFSGPCTGITIRDMRVNVTDGTRTAAVGSDGNATGIAGIKILGNDLRGAIDTVVMNDAVNGLWVVDNTASTVEYPVGSTVGTVEGNISFTTETV